MNKLEKYIRDNKSLFDEEPAPGHFERLQRKMNRKSKRTVTISWSVSVAAAVAIVFLIGIIRQNPGEKAGMPATCENAVDMKLCYLEKMNDVAGRIELLTKDFDPWDKQQIMMDVQNIIDMAGNDLENEIPKELLGNRAKEILSDYYRQNLESLGMIVNELTSL